MATYRVRWQRWSPEDGVMGQATVTDHIFSDHPEQTHGYGMLSDIHRGLLAIGIDAVLERDADEWEPQQPTPSPEPPRRRRLFGGNR